jgi:hypothetical protein
MLLLSLLHLFRELIINCLLDLTLIIEELLTLPLRVVHLAEEVDKTLEEA